MKKKNVATKVKLQCEKKWRKREREGRKRI